MVISTKQLRVQPGKIISQVSNGLDVTVTYRGKACAKIIPIAKNKPADIENAEDEIFGIWKNRKETKNVDEYIRSMRKGRKL